MEIKEGCILRDKNQVRKDKDNICATNREESGFVALYYLLEQKTHEAWILLPIAIEYLHSMILLT